MADDGIVAPEVDEDLRPPADGAPDDAEEAPSGGRGPGLVIAAIVLALVMAVAWVAVSAMGKGALGQDPFGVAAPDFELPKLEGEGTIALKDLKGHPVVLNFWASWCGPCKDEAPILAATEKQWRSEGVVFLGVDTQDKRPEAIAFENTYGIEYDSAFDEQGELSTLYGVLGYPETFFIDAKGKIHAKYVGPIDQETLDAYLAQITAK